jgi:hypothetical protein
VRVGLLSKTRRGSCRLATPRPKPRGPRLGATRCAWLVILTCVWVTDAHSGIEFPSVVDRAIGIRVGAGDLFVTGAASRRCVEVGDVELFGMAGLRVSGLRASGQWGSVPVGVSAARLASPVGSESRVDIELGYVTASHSRCVLRVGVEMIEIAGATPERSLIAGALARADVGAVSALADVDVVSRAYASEVDVVLGIVARAGRNVAVVATTRFDGTRAAAVGVAVVSRLTGALSLLGGYDDGTESVRAAAVVTLDAWQLSSGVSYHAVLGVSHGVTLAWTR